MTGRQQPNGQVSARRAAEVIKKLANRDGGISGSLGFLGDNVLHCCECDSPMLGETTPSAYPWPAFENALYRCPGGTLRSAHSAMTVWRADLELRRIMLSRLTNPSHPSGWRSSRLAELNVEIAEESLIYDWCLLRRHRWSTRWGLGLLSLVSVQEGIHLLSERLVALIEERAALIGAAGSDNCPSLSVLQLALRELRTKRHIQDSQYELFSRLLKNEEWRDPDQARLPGKDPALQSDWVKYPFSQVKRRRELLRIAMNTDKLVVRRIDGSPCICVVDDGQ